MKKSLQYQFGFNAFKLGFSLATNPYTVRDGNLHTEWNEGWEAARQQDEWNRIPEVPYLEHQPTDICG